MKSKSGRAEGQYPQAHSVILGNGLVQGQELEQSILVGSFQMSIFCDVMVENDIFKSNSMNSLSASRN